jgi:hypothetical protein
VNGFNFRKAEDIVYCYSLENGKNYEDAQKLIAEYNETTASEMYSEDDYTKRTHTLRNIFSNLAVMSENDFLDKLCQNKKNFLAYSVTAYEEVLNLGERLKEFYLKILPSTINFASAAE